MTSHPDVEALAFFAEELLEPDEERAVASHTDTCAICAATLDELTGVTRALAAVPTPAMPQDVADLLDRRIADAVRERTDGAPALPTSVSSDPSSSEDPTAAAAAGHVPEASGATVIPISRRRRGTNRSGGATLPRLLMAAAAVVVVCGGGAAVLNSVLSEHDDGLEGVAAPLQMTEEEVAPDTAQTHAPQVVRSGTVYTGESLSEQAAGTLDLSPLGGAATDGTGAEPIEPLESLTSGVEECALVLGDEVGTPFTLVDDAHYGDAGTRAWVLFAPVGETYEVYVVDPRCAQGGDTSESVLAQETVQAP